MNIISIIKNSSLVEKTPAIKQKIELREKDEKILRELWEKVQNIAKKYYDVCRKNIFFTIGEEILLNAKNLRVKKLCKKLTDRYIGFFKIIKAVGLNVYQLKFPEQYGKLYKTFYVSLFKLYMRRAGEEPPGFIFFNKDNRYLVESIRIERILKSKI